MAPKRRGRRSKKVPRGGYRRDAALDAMREYGFEDELIETTVDELLEVYEGGWLFIEDSSYHVLREALLAKSNTTEETGNPVEERDFDLETGGAVTENEVGADAAGNLERATTIHCSVGDAALVGEPSIMRSKSATAGDLVVSVEAEVERPIGCLTLTDPGAAGPSSIIVLPCSNMQATCEDGSSEIYAEPLSAVSSSKGNDANPFGDGVELQPSESSNEHVPDSKPAEHGESSGCKDMDLGEDDRNGSVDPSSSRQPLPAPLRQRRKRELKPCYGWLSDDESDDEITRSTISCNLNPHHCLVTSRNLDRESASSLNRTRLFHQVKKLVQQDISWTHQPLFPPVRFFHSLTTPMHLLSS